MSTRPIREALEKMQKARVDHEAHSAALEAVRAIEEMAKVLMTVGDVTVDGTVVTIKLADEAETRRVIEAIDHCESIAKEAP